MALNKFSKERRRLWHAYLDYQIEWEELQTKLNELEIKRQEYYK